MRQKIGWSLWCRAVLTLSPPRKEMLNGFFLTHMQPNQTFLDELFNTNWTSATHTSFEHDICSVLPESTEVMVTCWAIDVSSEEIAYEPSLACEPSFA